MSRFERLVSADLSGLRLIKRVSGEMIRDERRRRHITQEEFARALNVSGRWMREIEAGNSASRLEDHLHGAMLLGLPTAHISLAILFVASGMPVPRHILHADTAVLERECVDLIAAGSIKALTNELTPHWWPEQGNV
jgi:transcriptional regulator with XRE-family HTH domain